MARLALLLSAVIVAAIVALALLSALPTGPERAPTPAGRGTLILLLVDNHGAPGLESPWGLSVYVETRSATFLFDAGPEPGALERNAQALKANLSGLDFVIVSHEHWDHVGGLELVAKLKPGLRVYVPSGSSPSLAAWLRSMGLKPIPVSRTTRVAPGVYVVGQLYGPPYEQAAAILTPRGLVLLVGCSHPGADRIAEKALGEVRAEPYAILGGFHLVGSPPGKARKVADKLVSLGFKKIFPVHCSGDRIREYLASRYPDRYGDGRVGLRIML